MSQPTEAPTQPPGERLSSSHHTGTKKAARSATPPTSPIGCGRLQTAMGNWRLVYPHMEVSTWSPYSRSFGPDNLRPGCSSHSLWVHAFPAHALLLALFPPQGEHEKLRQSKLATSRSCSASPSSYPMAHGFFESRAPSNCGTNGSDVVAISRPRLLGPTHLHRRRRNAQPSAWST